MERHPHSSCFLCSYQQSWNGVPDASPNGKRSSSKTLPSACEARQSRAEEVAIVWSTLLFPFCLSLSSSVSLSLSSDFPFSFFFSLSVVFPILFFLSIPVFLVSSSFSFSSYLSFSLSFSFTSSFSFSVFFSCSSNFSFCFSSLSSPSLLYLLYLSLSFSVFFSFSLHLFLFLFLFFLFFIFLLFLLLSFSCGGYLFFWRGGSQKESKSSSTLRHSKLKTYMGPHSLLICCSHDKNYMRRQTKPTAPFEVLWPLQCPEGCFEATFGMWFLFFFSMSHFGGPKNTN